MNRLITLKLNLCPDKIHFKEISLLVKISPDHLSLKLRFSRYKVWRNQRWRAHFEILTSAEVANDDTNGAKIQTSGENWAAILSLWMGKSLSTAHWHIGIVLDFRSIGPWIDPCLRPQVFITNWKCIVQKKFKNCRLSYNHFQLQLKTCEFTNLLHHTLSLER